MVIMVIALACLAINLDLAFACNRFDFDPHNCNCKVNCKETVKYNLEKDVETVDPQIMIRNCTCKCIVVCFKRGAEVIENIMINPSLIGLVKLPEGKYSYTVKASHDNSDIIKKGKQYFEKGSRYSWDVSVKERIIECRIACSPCKCAKPSCKMCAPVKCECKRCAEVKPAAACECGMPECKGCSNVAVSKAQKSLKYNVEPQEVKAGCEAGLCKDMCKKENFNFVCNKKEHCKPEFCKGMCEKENFKKDACKYGCQKQEHRGPEFCKGMCSKQACAMHKHHFGMCKHHGMQHGPVPPPIMAPCFAAEKCAMHTSELAVVNDTKYAVAFRVGDFMQSAVAPGEQKIVTVAPGTYNFYASTSCADAKPICSNETFMCGNRHTLKIFVDQPEVKAEEKEVKAEVKKVRPALKTLKKK